MRTILAAFAATLLIGTVATAATHSVKQTGTTSQGKTLSFRYHPNARTLTNTTINYTAKCPNTYKGFVQPGQINVRKDGTFFFKHVFTYAMNGGTARVDYKFTGTITNAGHKAHGFYRAKVDLPRVGTCRTGTVSWQTKG